MDITSYVTKYKYEDEDEVFEFHLDFKFEYVKTSVFISEPYIIKLEYWNKMISSIENNQKFNIYLYQGNGDGSISCDGENVIFKALPSGAGGDMMVSISIPINKYKELLISNLKNLIDNEYSQAYWNRKK